jgi:NhaA family Na+:H+ antiporter
MKHEPDDARGTTVRLLSPFLDFLKTEALGAILLASSAILALIWANSPWSGSYENLWSARFAITVAGQSLDLDLRHWVNDGLMTIFFFVVGLEIKREITSGHLANRRAALLPVVAAIGGMAVPALIYLLVAGQTAPRGWAIPMATDIALAIGVMSVAKGRTPASLRAFLLGLAIVDDIGAIVIIAVVYSSGVAFGWLTAAGVGIGMALLIRRTGVQSVLVYVVVGIAVWYALFEGGIHPTIAGVIMGVMAPTTARSESNFIDIEEVDDFSRSDDGSTDDAKGKGSVSVVEWLEHVLHPWSSYFIVPVFALANSGIHVSIDGLRDAAGSAVTWGVFLGLLMGKPLGIILATKIAVRTGVADSPVGATGTHMLGAGTAAGIGFTVALFITELALDNPVDQTNAKLAILLASVVAVIAALAILLTRKTADA